MRRHHERPLGAELPAGGVRFRLWVPIPPISDGRLLNPFADLKALPGSPLSAAFLLKPPVAG
jgi:hypothetical protein